MRGAQNRNGDEYSPASFPDALTQQICRCRFPAETRRNTTRRPAPHRPGKRPYHFDINDTVHLSVRNDPEKVRPLHTMPSWKSGSLRVGRSGGREVWAVFDDHQERFSGPRRMRRIPVSRSPQTRAHEPGRGRPDGSSRASPIEYAPALPMKGRDFSPGASYPVQQCTISRVNR